ncbi:DUF86 domain-containing protein [Paenibacillus sp. J5C_2022]|uniref:DUF86 domain-containing protein n=1 Tax=Paenibacillus sp. J5C2022 TaxID=2977129 RepID=UPI0021D0639D|nr:HepT-like ribonuclease domain-containing protein [Paenibacillus sp. J5C2022]MCU6707564.1 DUF86 domain-containing protein [Paenibacillus sp. J5C2022]
MYYVNEEQIKVRLATIPELAAALERIAAEWNGDALQGLAQERALHQAIEIVTDVGSYLIDGFLMRDASSYEDIITITGAEGVFPSDMTGTLTELVKLRKPLVQEYYSWNRGVLHPLTAVMAERLPAFKDAVEAYLAREL